MQIFKLMSNRSFAATLAAWTGDKGRNIRDMFWQLVANGIVRTYDTNDVSHVNKLVAMAVNTGQLRRFERLAAKLVPFAYDSGARLFGGKRQDGKYKAMSETWEQLLSDAILTENDSNNKAKSAYNFDKALASFVKRANKHDFDNSEIQSAVVTYLSVGEAKAA